MVFFEVNSVEYNLKKKKQKTQTGIEIVVYIHTVENDPESNITGYKGVYIHWNLTLYPVTSSGVDNLRKYTKW